MSSVKGTFQNGVARPLEPVSEAHEGQAVIITFVDEPSQAASADKSAARGKLRRHFGAWDSGNVRSADDGAEWNALAELLDDSAVDTDIPDLAHEHDHYLYGKTKKS